MQPFVRKLTLTAAATLAVLGTAEFLLRRSAPHCGVTPFQLSTVPGLSAEFRPGFETLYKGQPLRINSAGYRGPDFPARESGVLRIALVGDSFVFGSAIAWEDTLGVRLEQALAARGLSAQVLNLGVPGYCALDVAALVEHRALPLDVDLVLYVFFANDIEPQQRYDAIPSGAVIDGLYGYPLRSALCEWLKVRTIQLALTCGWSIGRATTEGWLELYEQDGGGARLCTALERMQAACGRAEVRLALATYPFLTRIDLSPFRLMDARALSQAQALGIESVDLLGAFAGEADLSHYWASVFDSHPDGEANERAARHLAAELWP